MAQININELIKQISFAEPVLVKEAEKHARNQIFLPAVEAMKADFEIDPVTKEIDNGVDARNASNTLVGGKSKKQKNLWSFIGFDQDDDSPTDAIRAFLDPKHQSGPKMKYIRGSQVKNLVFSFQVIPPDQDAIYDATPMPWGAGLSWAERIELGVPGFESFLNKKGLETRNGSRSGGGIQVKNQLRRGYFRTRLYMTKILRNFMTKFR